MSFRNQLTLELPLPAASFASMHFNWWLEQHHSAWIWLRFEMEMALSLSKNQIHSILSYCAHAIPLLNMENKGLKKRGAKLPLPPYDTLYFPYSANKLRWRRKNSSGWFERKTVSQKHHIQKNNASKLSTKDDLPVGLSPRPCSCSQEIDGQQGL